MAATLPNRSRLEEPLAELFGCSTRCEVPWAVLLEALSVELMDTPPTEARTLRLEVPVAVTSSGVLNVDVPLAMVEARMFKLELPVAVLVAGVLKLEVPLAVSVASTSRMEMPLAVDVLAMS